MRKDTFDKRWERYARKSDEYALGKQEAMPYIDDDEEDPMRPNYAFYAAVLIVFGLFCILLYLVLKTILFS